MPLVVRFFTVLGIMLLAGKLTGELCERMRQPPVLGELVVGILLGGSVLGVIPTAPADPLTPVIQLLAQVGVVVLLFEIGVATELRALMRVGPAAPNPFSGLLRVPVEVPVTAGARVRAYVLDARGLLVARLYDGVAPGGRMSLMWNGSDARGRTVASGVYWLVAESGGERHAVRLVRIR